MAIVKIYLMGKKHLIGPVLEENFLQEIDEISFQIHHATEEFNNNIH